MVHSIYGVTWWFWFYSLFCLLNSFLFLFLYFFVFLSVMVEIWFYILPRCLLGKMMKMGDSRCTILLFFGGGGVVSLHLWQKMSKTTLSCLRMQESHISVIDWTLYNILFLEIRKWTIKLIFTFCHYYSYRILLLLLINQLIIILLLVFILRVVNSSMSSTLLCEW